MSGEPRTRVLIVDDEPLARELIRHLLAEERQVEIVGECRSGPQAIGAIEDLRPDLVFLDVQMPDVDGFAVLRALDPARLPVVVFVTAHDQYALRAFEAQALDYLLKPIDPDRFRRALGRAREQLRQRRAGAVQDQLLALLGETGGRRRYLERLVLKEDGRTLFLRVQDVDWIQSAGNYLKIQAGATSHLLRGTMGWLEEQLDPAAFLRIHRTTVVSIDRIQEVQGTLYGGAVVVLRTGARLACGRSYRGRVRALLRGND